VALTPQHVTVHQIRSMDAQEYAYLQRRVDQLESDVAVTGGRLDDSRATCDQLHKALEHQRALQAAVARAVSVCANTIELALLSLQNLNAFLATQVQEVRTDRVVEIVAASQERQTQEDPS
jgi:hypothetical protein